MTNAITLPQPLAGETEPYRLFGTAKAKPGLGDALGERLLTLVKPTRSEAGAFQYHVHRDRNDPDLFAFYEAWASIDHLREHLATPYVAAFLNDRMTYLERDMDIHFVRMVSPYPDRTSSATTS
jgi:Uncharacterized conserved protein